MFLLQNKNLYKCVDEVLTIVSWAENDILPLACVELNRQDGAGDGMGDRDKESTLPDRILQVNPFPNTPF